MAATMTWRSFVLIAPSQRTRRAVGDERKACARCAARRSLAETVMTHSEAAVRSHAVTAGILTAIAVVLAIAITAAFGATGVIILAATLPFPILVLWRAVGDVLADEAA
jgi:hypothetical protein